MLFDEDSISLIPPFAAPPPAVPPAYVATTIHEVNKYYQTALAAADDNAFGLAPEIFLTICITGIVIASFCVGLLLICHRGAIRQCCGLAPQTAAVRQPDQALAEHQGEGDDDDDSIVADDDAPAEKQPVVPNEDTESPSELTIGSAADDRNAQHTRKCCAQVAQALERGENTTGRKSPVLPSLKRNGNGKFKKVSNLDMDL